MWLAGVSVRARGRHSLDGGRGGQGTFPHTTVASNCLQGSQGITHNRLYYITLYGLLVPCQLIIEVSGCLHRQATLPTCRVLPSLSDISAKFASIWLAVQRVRLAILPALRPSRRDSESGRILLMSIVRSILPRAEIQFQIHREGWRIRIAREAEDYTAVSRQYIENCVLRSANTW